MAKRRNRFKFTEKKQSIRGIASLVLAVAFLMIFAAFVGKASNVGGTLSMYYGSAGVFFMLCSIVDFVEAIISTREEDSFQVFPKLAVALSLFNMLCWIGTYVHGFLHL